MWTFIPFLVALVATGLCAPPPADPNLKPCGDAYYLESQYTCYDGDYLCPVIDGEPTLRCDAECYKPEVYGCNDGKLVYPSSSAESVKGTGGASASSSMTASAPSSSPSTPTSSSAPGCPNAPTTQHLSDPPYEDYFYSDCHSASQVVITSPLPDSNLIIIGPRLLVAWPAGNSGVVAFFAPQNGINGTLGIELAGGDQPLSGIYTPVSGRSGFPTVGVSMVLSLNSSAVLNVAILGSIRTIRDFTEGPSILVPEVQDAITVRHGAAEVGLHTQGDTVGATLSRTWLDNVTTTVLSFSPQSNGTGAITIKNDTLYFEAGQYSVSAMFDYPQLTQLSAPEVLNEKSQDLIQQNSDQTTSLSFLSYSEKLLAGAWRFLTYFGRDSMISLLLLQPVLSEGEGSATEAVISAVLERINKTDGSVCHEETIGDYATYLNLQNNITGEAALMPGCTYQMIDTDYYLMVVMEKYFLNSATGRARRNAFFATKAMLDFGNQGMSYADLALLNAEKVMRTSAAFAADGGQTEANLVHLKAGQIVGEWRDSTYGIGGGRIPYDVNTALVPAALRSIAALSAAGFFPSHPEWNTSAAEYAQVWEDRTLHFFEVTVPEAEAKQLVTSYAQEAGYGFPSQADNITADVVYHGLALMGNNDQPLIKVMNTDDCFRHFLLNTTNQIQLTSFINQTANNILAPFPAGLSTPVGLLVANPAYGSDPVYAANWTNNAYHGTVVWSWPMSMMAAGLQRQIGRCSGSPAPDFCSDVTVRGNALAAYSHLWDLIEANQAQLSSEVWSWLYRGGDFVYESFGALPPPPGQSPTESDIRQLWSLTFLAVARDESLR